MGGRGSAGVGSGGGLPNMRMPEITGSEKQVAWAKSILQEGIDTIKGNYERFSKLSGPGQLTSKQWQSVAAAYNNMLTARKTISASDIIDKRQGLGAQAVVRQAQQIGMMASTGKLIWDAKSRQYVPAK